jgi:hypothetical protein
VKICPPAPIGDGDQSRRDPAPMATKWKEAAQNVSVGAASSVKRRVDG